MSDDRELHRNLINNAGRKVYRRKKKWQGASWAPERGAAMFGDGVWCPKCRTRHGYMKMGIQYFRTHQGKWQILWKCPVTQNVLKEQDLG